MHIRIARHINFQHQIGRRVNAPVNAFFTRNGLPMVDVKAIVGFDPTFLWEFHGDRSKGIVLTPLMIQENFNNIGN